MDHNILHMVYIFNGHGCSDHESTVCSWRYLHSIAMLTGNCSPCIFIAHHLQQQIPVTRSVYGQCGVNQNARGWILMSDCLVLDVNHMAQADSSSTGFYVGLLKLQAVQV